MIEPKPKRKKEDYINVSVPRNNYLQIKDFLEKYFEGASIAKFYDNGAMERMYRIQKRNTPIDLLSGSKLLSLGWAQISNATYQKEKNIIMYSGTYWFFNGEQITPENYHEKLGNKTKAKL